MKFSADPKEKAVFIKLFYIMYGLKFYLKIDKLIKDGDYKMVL